MRLAFVLALSIAAASSAHAAECAKNASGQPMATGNGKANPKAAGKGQSRLQAERAAFLDALTNLRGCLDKAKSPTGWSIADVRYFDSDPIVEVDVVALFDGAPQVTVLGSAVPNTDSGETNVKKLRLSTQTAAKTVAQRNAAEALNVVFPEGTAGDLKHELSGSLSSCQPIDIAYWADAAVSVKLTCGKGVNVPPVSGHDAPALQKH